jgi:hypothetical protein
MCTQTPTYWISSLIASNISSRDAMFDVAKKWMLNTDCCICCGSPAKVTRNELCLFHFLLWFLDVSLHHNQIGTDKTCLPRALACHGFSAGCVQGCMLNAGPSRSTPITCKIHVYQYLQTRPTMYPLWTWHAPDSMVSVELWKRELKVVKRDLKRPRETVDHPRARPLSHHMTCLSKHSPVLHEETSGHDGKILIVHKGNSRLVHKVVLPISSMSHWTNIVGQSQVSPLLKMEHLALSSTRPLLIICPYMRTYLRIRPFLSNE